MPATTLQTAAYVRPSTEKQDDQHQRDSIVEYIERELDLQENQVDWYADIDSGSKSTRDQFRDLLDDISSGELDHVVVWEISRIARDGEVLQKFFNRCEENDVVIHVTDGAIDQVHPDGTGRFVADILGTVYAQERRRLISRVKSGLSTARDEGKWLGNVPAGFRIVDGWLEPIIEAREGEGDSFLEIQDALERVENGESYRSVAKPLEMTRQGLSRLHKSDRAGWYLDLEADDDRVEDALDDLRGDSSGGDT